MARLFHPSHRLHESRLDAINHPGDGSIPSMAQKSRFLSVTILAVVVISSVTFQHLSCQPVRRFLPSRELLARPIAAPRAPVTAAKLVFNSDAPSEFDYSVVGLAALGTSLPLYLISGDGIEDGLVVGVEAAVFGRFAITKITRDLIASDWVFAVPFTRHIGQSWLQLRYHHMSSHMGDEYILRFDSYEDAFSRDAAELTAYHQASPGLGLYGGGSWAFNTHPDELRSLLVHAGVEAETSDEGQVLLPYAAADVEWDQDNAWEPRLNMQIGVRLPGIEGRRSLRLAAEFLSGPAPIGQLRAERMRQLTIGLYIDP